MNRSGTAFKPRHTRLSPAPVPQAWRGECIRLRCFLASPFIANQGKDDPDSEGHHRIGNLGRAVWEISLGNACSKQDSCDHPGCGPMAYPRLRQQPYQAAIQKKLLEE